jgi:hypothetical protein
VDVIDTSVSSVLSVGGKHGEICHGGATVDKKNNSGQAKQSDGTLSIHLWVSIPSHIPNPCPAKPTSMSLQSIQNKWIQVSAVTAEQASCNQNHNNHIRPNSCSGMPAELEICLQIQQVGHVMYAGVRRLQHTRPEPPSNWRCWTMQDVQQPVPLSSCQQVRQWPQQPQVCTGWVGGGVTLHQSLPSPQQLGHGCFSASPSASRRCHTFLLTPTSKHMSTHTQAHRHRCKHTCAPLLHTPWWDDQCKLHAVSTPCMPNADASPATLGSLELLS